MKNAMHTIRVLIELKSVTKVYRKGALETQASWWVLIQIAWLAVTNETGASLGLRRRRRRSAASKARS